MYSNLKKQKKLLQSNRKMLDLLCIYCTFARRKFLLIYYIRITTKFIFYETESATDGYLGFGGSHEFV